MCSVLFIGIRFYGRPFHCANYYYFVKTISFSYHGRGLLSDVCIALELHFDVSKRILQLGPRAVNKIIHAMRREKISL